MKIKLTFIIKQQQIYTTRTTLSTQKNKRNFSTIASRVRASPSRSNCRCRIPDQQEWKDRRLTRNFSGHHHQTAAVVTTAQSPLLPSQQLRRCHKWDGHDTTGRSPFCSTSTNSRFAVSGTTERLSHKIRHRTHRQHHERVSSRPSYVLHVRRRRGLSLTT